MDFVSSVFTFSPIDEVFQFPTISFQHPPIQKEFNSDITLKPDYSQRGRKPSVAFDNSNNNPFDYNQRIKKIVHRDVERERRKEMAALHTSLKSSLPPEYLKGKKCISDHIDEAVNYIRHLEKRVEEMSQKRDELKRLSSSLNESTENIFGSKCLALATSRVEEMSVRVEIVSEGRVEVIVSTASNGGVPVSKLLDVLLQEGLTVICCISTNVNERLLHSIESELSDGGSINQCELQKKLSDLVA